MSTKVEQTRERILAEAGRLFQKQGFRATGLSDLLAATGSKKGVLYFHFADKDEIGQAVLEGARAELEIFLDETLVEGCAGACLENFFAGLLDRQREIRFVGGCIFGNIALEMMMPTSASPPSSSGFFPTGSRASVGSLARPGPRGRSAAIFPAKSCPDIS